MISLTVNGVAFSYPQTGDNAWGSGATGWAQAVTSGMLSLAGGSFPLTAQVDFGANFGIKVLSITSETANPASSGFLRFANTDAIGFRNIGNSADFLLKPSADGILQYNSIDLVNLSASQVLTNKTLTSAILTTPTLNSSGGLLTLPAGPDTLVGRATTDTLTNKTISGASNTLSNIPNSATTATNLNTASAIVARDASGNFSAGTITAALSGNATSATSATSITGNLTGDVTSVGMATTIAALAVTDAKVATGISGSKISGNISGNAANVTGTVAIGNGGTGQTTAAAAFDALAPTTTNGDLIARAAGTNARIPVGSSGQVLKVVGGAPAWATFSGGINYVSANPDAESDTSGWATYSNTAANTPSSGTGGTATGLTFSRSTSSPLRGTGSFLIAQTNSTNIQGKGVSYDFSTDSADKAKPLAISFDYNASSTFVASNGTTAPLNDGTTTTNAGNSDVEVFLYDVTNSALIPVSPQVITANGSNNFSFKGTFQTASNSTSYRLIFHVATASSNATGWQFKFDNVYVGPQVTTQGGIATDYKNFTPTITASTANPTLGTNTQEGRYRQIGDSVEIQYTLNQTSAGTGGTGVYRFSLPSGLTIDSTKLTQYSAAVGLSAVGTATLWDGSNTYVGYVYAGGSNWLEIVAGYSQTTMVPMTAATLSFANTNVRVSFKAMVPVAGWASSTTLSNETDTRVVGGNFTGAPPTGTLNGSYNAVTFGTTVKDTHGSYSSNTYTIPVSGLYNISAQVAVAATYAAGNGSGIEVVINGTSKARGDQVAGSSSVTVLKPSVTLLSYPLTAGDTVVIKAQSDGASPTYASSTDVNWFTIARNSGPATIAASESVNARYKSTTATSFAANGNIFNYDTKDFDSHSAVTTGASWKFVAPVSGTYRVSTNLVTAAAASSLVGKSIAQEVFKNGSTTNIFFANHFSQTTTSSQRASSGSTLIKLIAGDYIDLRTSSDDATAFVLNGSGASNYVSIERVGN